MGESDFKCFFYYFDESFRSVNFARNDFLYGWTGAGVGIQASPVSIQRLNVDRVHVDQLRQCDAHGRAPKEFLIGTFFALLLCVAPFIPSAALACVACSAYANER
ncbi:hypothetical protein [Streptomyces sp. NPDC001068]|uniref:hypothetical protein n=1 Tax=Streptomyces sp. NPDC001068 TaxID=3364544 RepID=UPI0036AE9916